MANDFNTLEELNNITRLTYELYTAMKEIVDKVPTFLLSSLAKG